MFKGFMKKIEYSFEKFLKIDNKRGEEYVWVGEGSAPVIEDEN